MFHLDLSFKMMNKLRTDWITVKYNPKKSLEVNINYFFLFSLIEIPKNHVTTFKECI